MPTVVTDCPRCGAQHMTFDVLADVNAGKSFDWRTNHELAVKCRRCKRMAILVVTLDDINKQRDFLESGTVSQLAGDTEPTFKTRKFLDVTDLKGIAEPPEHLPEKVKAAFDEAAKCMAIGCHNAAAAMFRLCLDLATKPLLPGPADASAAQPSKEERFVLAKRIDWLIKQGHIPSSLSKLAHSVRQDGNDGAHDGSLDEKDAEDLLDFATALLERQFTEPERLRQAELRRIDRRGGGVASDTPKAEGG